MKGATAATVGSSWIDALGGFVGLKRRSVPPVFWAAAGPPDSTVATASRTVVLIVRALMVLPLSCRRHAMPPIYADARVSDDDPSAKAIACTAKCRGARVRLGD